MITDFDRQVLFALRHIAAIDNYDPCWIEGKRVMLVSGDHRRCVYARAQDELQNSSRSLWRLVVVINAFRHLKSNNLLYSHHDAGIYWVVMDE